MAELVRRWLLVLLLVWLVLIGVRQTLDLIGRLWLSVAINLIQVRKRRRATSADRFLFFVGSRNRRRLFACRFWFVSPAFLASLAVVARF